MARRFRNPHPQLLVTPNFLSPAHEPWRQRQKSARNETNRVMSPSNQDLVQGRRPFETSERQTREPFAINESTKSEPVGLLLIHKSCVHFLVREKRVHLRSPSSGSAARAGEPSGGACGCRRPTCGSRRPRCTGCCSRGTGGWPPSAGAGCTAWSH